jgi:PAS domain S-box-containing protein
MSQKNLFFLSILFILLTPSLFAFNRNSKVLLLNSYHKGYIWSDEITRGVEENLDHRNIDLFVEFMDTKRVYDKTYLDLLEELYTEKYRGITLDLIITSDNNAINFFRDRGERIWGKVPQIFCGYNFLRPDFANSLKNATGINEEADILGNIDLIMSLHRKTERILIITDNTTTGRRIQEEVERIRTTLGPEQPEIDLMYDFNKEELINNIRELPPNTAILLTFFFIDREGEIYSTEEMTTLLHEYTTVPLYGTWNFSFGHGIIGGSLVNGYDQGLMTADMALKILQDIPVKALPVEYKTPFNMKFDYRELKRFGIHLSSLPEGSEIYFRPDTFYTRHTRTIWTIFIIISVQTAAMIFLLYINRAKKRAEKKLTAQGNFLKLIIRHIPDRIYWKDRELNFLGCNKAFSESIGIGEEDITGCKTEDIIRENRIAADWDKEDQSVMKNNEPLIDKEIMITTEEGEYKWFLESRIPIHNEKGICIGILGLEEDITAEKRDRKTIEMGEKKLRTIIDAIPGHIFVKNKTGNYLMANAYTAIFNGYDITETENWQENSIRPTFLQSDEILKGDKYIFETGEPLTNIQENLTSAEGKDFWFQITKIPCPSELFDEPAILGVGMDITALKEAEKALLNREEDLQITLDSIGDGVITTDVNGDITRMNPVAETLTGWTNDEAFKQPITAVLPLYQQNKKNSPVNPVDLIMKEMRTTFFSTTLMTTNREEKELPLHFSCSPIKNESGSIRGAVIVLQDMTEDVQLRKQLSHTEKMDTLGQLASGITHDFNNMLGGILGASQLIKPYLNEKEEGQEYLDLIISTTKKAADLAKDLLIFSRRGTKENTTFNLEKVIDETISLLKRTLDKKVNISVDLTGEYCPVQGDSSQIQSAFMNLGINASHAMKEGGNITVKAEKIYLNKDEGEQSPFELSSGAYLKIIFKDNGSGIPQEIMGKIFDPFFTTKEEGKGTGLGLAAVYRTVQQHGGFIDVESREGVGTTFTVGLPLLAGEKSLSREIADEKVSGTGHILIIDDDMAMRITAKEILKDLGYLVSVAEDGKKGLEFFEKHYQSLDLVILDMIMPHMNGKDCFLAMKGIKPDLKAVITSGYTSEEDITALKSNGLAGFCRKPYTIAQLSQVIEKALKN